ncbi:hypothetical protein ASC89_19530 [Devosia sp. Root413D1]|nr:hypothetical protein ASC89_19530 [Devosia sp. Root413D1]
MKEGIEVKRILPAVLAFGLLGAMTGQTLAESCFDLWMARNTIYDDNGYCFSTELAQEYFDNDDCWTRKPKFSKAERREIEAIKQEEDDRGCKVN